MTAAEITQALGWALIHSFWQGALLAILLFLTLALLPEHWSKTRYRVSVIAQLAMFLLWCGTLFFYLLRAPSGSIPLGFSSSQAVVAGGAVESYRAWSGVMDLIALRLDWIVGLWALGVALASMRMVGGFLQVQRLRARAQPGPQTWQKKVAEWQRQLGIRSKVKLLRSSTVTCPVVIGHLRPAILVPIHAFTGMPAHELESLIWHELGHIARRDYLINLIQTLIDILFFFHPGAWWISARVREERECCCDQYALARTPPMVLARALTNVQEANMIFSPKLSQAARGSGQLERRVRRMMGDNRNHHTLPRIIASLALISSLFLLSLCTSAARGGAYAADPQHAQSGQNRTYITHHGEERIEFTLVDGEVIALHVDGQEVPSSDWSHYQDIIQDAKDREKVSQARNRKIKKEWEARERYRQARQRDQQAADRYEEEAYLKRRLEREERQAYREERALERQQGQILKEREELSRMKRELAGQRQLERDVERERRAMEREKRLRYQDARDHYKDALAEEVARERRELETRKRQMERRARISRDDNLAARTRKERSQSRKERPGQRSDARKQRSQNSPNFQKIELDLVQKEAILQELKERIAQQEATLKEQQRKLIRQEKLIQEQMRQLERFLVEREKEQ